MKVGRYTPILAHLFALHPWDIARLTWAEFESYCAFADEVTKEQADLA